MELERPRMVAVLPRGETLRNFVYSEVLDELQLDLDLRVLSVFPNANVWRLLESRYGDVRRLDETPERWPVRILREILDLAHGRWLWSEAARERWETRDARERAPGRRIRRAIKKLACYPFASRRGLEVLGGLERAASRALRTTDDYLELYRRLRPALVFNGSHSHCQAAVQPVQAATWCGIPTATFLFSWDNLTTHGRTFLHYDLYLAWNEDIREQLLGIYPRVGREQVIVTGTPQFDFHFQPGYRWSREEFCARVGADPRRPIVLYTTGMPHYTPGEPVIVERIADMLRGMTSFGPPQLLVRVYPKDTTTRFDDLRARRPDILMPPVPWEASCLTPLVEDLPLLTNTLRHAAVGINMASTVSLELCMFDTPVLNIGYDPPGLDVRPVEYARFYRFDHYRPLVESGAVEVAYSEEQLRGQLLAALSRPGARSAERRLLLRRFFGDTLDGRSGARVAQALRAAAVARTGARLDATSTRSAPEVGVAAGAR
jgi:hypothetical protein